MDDDDNGPDYYRADKMECVREIYARGVVINGEIVKDSIEIENFLSKADEVIEEAAVRAIQYRQGYDNVLRNEILPYLGSIEFDEAVNELMSDRGWKTRMGTREDLN
ncbi:hypothetical protein EYS14_03835 [Alteromonadaceae bacterium M269]|nr:hypothetical protein EYS14_03835 [Alteromonadaceae bacterium M269]